MMKCPICGNEYPSMMKECPFCSVEKARANDNSDTGSISGSLHVHDSKQKKHGMHWFFALILSLLSLSLVFLIIAFSLNDYSSDSWAIAFIVYLLSLLLPSASFCSAWFCLTNKRYRMSFVWKSFSLICIILLSFLTALSPFLASSYCNSSSNNTQSALALIIFISSFALLYAPHILIKRERKKRHETELPSDTDRAKSIGKQLAPIVVLFAGIAIGLFIGLSIDIVDRRSSLKYPNKDKYGRVSMVYVNTKKGNVFHSDSFCKLEEYLLGIDRNSFTEMSEYEAILRGFKRCPDCYKYATSSDVYGIEYSIQDIEDALKDY